MPKEFTQIREYTTVLNYSCCSMSWLSLCNYKSDFFISFCCYVGFDYLSMSALDPFFEFLHEFPRELIILAHFATAVHTLLLHIHQFAVINNIFHLPGIDSELQEVILPLSLPSPFITHCIYLTVLGNFSLHFGVQDDWKRSWR